MVIIGIHGLRGTGKDTLARKLGERFANAKIMALADKLKQTCALLFDIPLGAFYDQERKEKEKYNGRTPREIMIGFDLAVRPIFGDFVYLDAVTKFISEHESTVPVLIITDIRGEHEARYIRKLGGTIIHITRPDMLVKAKINHWSEAGIKVKRTDILCEIKEGMEYVDQASDYVISKIVNK